MTGHRDRGQRRHGVPFKQLGHGIDGEFVPEPAEPGDDPSGHRRQHRGVAEGLTPGRIGEVQLDGRAVKGGDGIVEGPRRVTQRPGVDDECLGPPTCGVDRFDQFTLVVGLVVLELEAVALCRGLGACHVVGQCGRAVDGRLARSQEVEIGSGQQDDQAHGFAPISARVASTSAGSTPRTGATPCGPSRTKVRSWCAFLSRRMKSSSSAAEAPAGRSTGRS